MLVHVQRAEYSGIAMYVAKLTLQEHGQDGQKPCSALSISVV
jgi:hypothetical protein